MNWKNDDQTITLRLWTDDDLPLLQRLMGTPEMTEHLGGPESSEQILSRHQRYCRSSSTGDGPMFVILIGSESAGSIGYWKRDWNTEEVLECGWSVLPEFQGRGAATKATVALIERLRRGGELRNVHAFPGVENAASNAICRKAGFELQGEVDFEYPPGHQMKCNDWVCDLRKGTSTADADG
jgi:RimJ/RimL family protein N-acetyltransferase